MSTVVHILQKAFRGRNVSGARIKGACFCDYSGYSYSGLGITEYTEFQCRKEYSFLKRNTHGGGDLRTTTMFAAA